MSNRPALAHVATRRRRSPAIPAPLAFVLAACTGLVLMACTGVPSGIEPVSDFEVDRYLGTWYEIARLDHRFERGLDNVSATYTRRDDGGVEVRNRGYDLEKDEWVEAIGRAYLNDDDGRGSLKVSFFGPFYGGYHVFELDRDDYTEALVAGPNRDYLWMLARSPRISPERQQRLVEIARAAGYDVDALIWVEHDRKDPALGE